MTYRRMLARGALSLLAVMAMIFVLAGRLDYGPGWGMAALLAVQYAVTAVVFADKPDLARERLRPGPGVKWWDRIFYALFVPATLAVFVIGCLDSGRFGWSPPFPAWVRGAGYLLYAAAGAVMTWAMAVNRFFSSMVRIQTDRGQVVVRSGPYRWVRHPGYAAGIPVVAAQALIFGSLWALAPALAAALLLIGRTVLEDRVLCRELPGYREYAGAVRFRLVPGLW